MIRTLTFITLAIIDTVICALIALIGGIFNPYSSFNNAVARIWARILLISAGIKLEVMGREKIQSGESYIVVANHQSQMDIPVVMVAIPLPLKFMAKKELFVVPFLGWGMKAVGMLKIDRGNTKQAVSTLKDAENLIRLHQLSILAFPEGTRSLDGKMKPFKKGAFVLAINTGLPILPVSISGTRKISQKGKKRIRSGRVKVVIHQPLPIAETEYENRSNLADRTHQIISEGLNENYE
jgi:1-acyl-sn-glycerol-3-phosphate acyltransferase